MHKTSGFKVKYIYFFLLLFCLIFNTKAEEPTALYLEKGETFYGYGDDEVLLKEARLINHPHIQKALQIRDEVARKNYLDIHSLLKLLEGKKFSKKHFDKALLLMKQDFLTLTQMGSHPNIQTEKFHVRHFIHLIREGGYYEIAERMLQEHGSSFFENKIPFQLLHRDISALKLALIYLLKAYKKEVDFNMLHMAYPVPLSPLFKGFENHVLFEKKSRILWFPHAGYVLGSDYLAPDNFKGTDCSGLIKQITNWPKHFGTKSIEEALLYQPRKKALLDPDLKNLSQRLKKLTRSKDLQPGDFVMWRWDKGGHIVIFVAPVDKDHFIGLEAALLPQANLEGLGARVLSYIRPNTNTYFIRYISNSSSKQ